MGKVGHLPNYLKLAAGKASLCVTETLVSRDHRFGRVLLLPGKALNYLPMEEVGLPSPIHPSLARFFLGTDQL